MSTNSVDISSRLVVAARTCPCDFCTGKKRYEDNWCARCAEVQLVLPKWWENMDVCDACDAVPRAEHRAEDDALDSKGGGT